MTRDWYIQGPCVVRVKGMGALSRNNAPRRLELGLTQGPIRVIPHISHRDVYVDDFGPDGPATSMISAGSASVLMTLSHYDESILHQCIQNSMGNYDAIYDVGTGANPEALDDQGIDITALSRAGYCGGTGKMMDGGKQRFESGNLFISLSISAQSHEQGDPRQTPYPWRFLTTYIDGNPAEIPLGTERSLVYIRWRAIMYRPIFRPSSTNNRVSSTTAQELRSIGIPIWDRRDDTET